MTLVDRVDDPVDAGLGSAFEVFVIRHGHIGPRDPEQRCIQIVERTALDLVHHLCPDSAERPTFFNNDTAICLHHAVKQRFGIERPDRPEIYYFGQQALGTFDPCRGFERQRYSL